MTVTLSPIGAIAGVLVFSIVCLIGVGLHQMVRARDKMLAEYKRREKVRQMAAHFKSSMAHELQPLGIRRISLVSDRNKVRPIIHRRRLNLHSRLFQNDPPRD